LAKALDEVPRPESLDETAQGVGKEREGFHGKCAEVHAINQALHEGVRLKGAVIRTAMVRPAGHPEAGMSIHPCASCEHVLKVFHSKYMR
jgi:cytidine deaminase